MTTEELHEHSKRIADENATLALAGVTVIIVLANEEGYSFGVRGSRELAALALAEAVDDAIDPEGWGNMNVGSA